MINPDNFKPVKVGRAYHMTKKPILSVSNRAINLNPPMVERLLDGQEITDKTPTGNLRIYVNLEYSRTDKAFRVSLGTPDTGYLFLTHYENVASTTTHTTANRGIPAAFKDMGVVKGTYVQKFPDQPDVFVLEVKPTKPTK